jgi:hypothetical protein
MDPPQNRPWSRHRIALMRTYLVLLNRCLAALVPINGASAEQENHEHGGPGDE